ncbi:hypothetical protein ASD79_03875 [Caulobacter sp. Root655]|uniref:hypothetical protein n=1 Tax=Caulobacter sp. Root655 TaxID=1736578 RepID=UPI0006FC4302|nr:hypothetical protein [Caulobacter sp. Root655]KRA66416.1 hypothetical protein ASD79_03875 [Caulobacter sp. Root655]
MRIEVKRALRHFLTSVAFLSVTSWFVAFAYADWLRFSSPASPNPATGQVIYEKAVRGVFYITPDQAFWAQQTLLPIWLTLMAAILLSRLVEVKDEPTDDGAPIWKALGLVVTIGLFAILFLGDYLLAPVFEILSPPAR